MRERPQERGIDLADGEGQGSDPQREFEREGRGDREGERRDQERPASVPAKCLGRNVGGGIAPIQMNLLFFDRQFSLPLFFFCGCIKTFWRLAPSSPKDRGGISPPQASGG